MMTDELREAQEAILTELQKEQKPIRPHVLVQTLRDERDLKEIDIREAIWILIGRGRIALSPERRIIMTDQQ